METPPAALRDVAAQAHRMVEQLVEFRRELHRDPELSFQEFRTAAKVAAALREIPGLSIQTGVATPPSRFT